MKILWAIMCSPCSSNHNQDASMVFVHAWAAFVNRYKDTLPCDFKFFNHNHPQQRMKQAIGDLPVYHYMKCTYHSGIANEILRVEEDYDYVVLCEHDSFPAPECIESICDYLRSHSYVNFVTASTTRSWWGLRNMMDDPDQPRPKGEYPWSARQASTGMIILKRQLYLDALEVFNGLGSMHEIPFNSNTLTYGRICQLLSKECDSKIANCMMGLDGPFSVDFWTSLNRAGIRPAELVNHDGKTLFSKTRCLGLGQMQPFESFNDVVDLPQQPENQVVADDKIVAPFLHIGGGHVMAMYFKGLEDPAWQSRFKELEHGNIGNPLTHYIIFRYFLDHCQDKQLRERHQRIFDEVVERGYVDVKQFDQAYQRVIDFYNDALQHYIPQETP